MSPQSGLSQRTPYGEGPVSASGPKSCEAIESTESLLMEESNKSNINSYDTAATGAEIFKRRLYDILLLTAICIMLAWPWAFFGVVFARGGLQATNQFTQLFMKNHRTVGFCSTLIANIIALAVDILFSFSIVRFAQEWVSDNEKVTTLDVSLILAFKGLTWPWSLQDFKNPRFRGMGLLLILLIMSILCSTFIPSTLTSLITPVIFMKTAPLSGTELDLSSTSPECRQWLSTNQISPNNCDWAMYGNYLYTTCLDGNQLVDILEAGRGQIQSLLFNNSQILSFSQLSDGGLHFEGPIRGVLPIGPEGVPAFDTLSTSPLSIQNERDGMISYNYTLDHQGLSSNVSCAYSTTSPVSANAVDGSDFVFQYNGTCVADGLEDVLDRSVGFVQVLSNSTLASWMCKSKQADSEPPEYYIYFRGSGEYRQTVGNMTCIVSSIRPTVFNLTYQSTPNAFFSQSNSVWRSLNFSFPGFLDRVMAGIISVVWEGQNWASNTVEDSVITFAKKRLNITSTVWNEEYLRLHEAMIQGFIDYEATYSRLLYSAISDRPASCTRNVTGTASYEVIGWSVDLKHIGFLIPITLMSLCALVIQVHAMTHSKSRTRAYYPTGIRPFLMAYIPWDDSRRGMDTNAHWDQKIRYYYEESSLK